MKSKQFKHNIIAIVYDFDGTLTPFPMQNYTVLPQIHINPDKFWQKVGRINKKTKGDKITTYMRLMLDECHQKKYALTPDNLRRLAAQIKYYPGVNSGFFKRLNHYVRKKGKGTIKLRHYIISSGLKKVLEATDISKNFHNIFASEYHYDHYKKPVFLKRVINGTQKTQYLFRINKGIEDLTKGINNYMPENERPIPFQNILYIGDGMTDVPSMTVTKKNNGYAIAVHDGSSQGLATCAELLDAGRVDFIAKADYEENSDLVKAIKLILDHIVSGIQYAGEAFRQTKKYLKE